MIHDMTVRVFVDLLGSYQTKYCLDLCRAVIALCVHTLSVLVLWATKTALYGHCTEQMHSIYYAAALVDCIEDGRFRAGSQAESSAAES